jgi:hypothetical protein
MTSKEQQLYDAAAAITFYSQNGKKNEGYVYPCASGAGAFVSSRNFILMNILAGHTPNLGNKQISRFQQTKRC